MAGWSVGSRQPLTRAQAASGPDGSRSFAAVPDPDPVAGCLPPESLSVHTQHPAQKSQGRIPTPQITGSPSGASSTANTPIFSAATHAPNPNNRCHVRVPKQLSWAWGVADELALRRAPAAEAAHAAGQAPPTVSSHQKRLSKPHPGHTQTHTRGLLGLFGVAPLVVPPPPNKHAPGASWGLVRVAPLVALVAPAPPLPAAQRFAPAMALLQGETMQQLHRQCTSPARLPAGTRLSPTHRRPPTR
jgi:hypothetical protein